ncbi:hypothetical protein EPN18_10085 [bacterium]|nr:MAG: hypothetical protein EPN18_10085 [bacterium]
MTDWVKEITANDLPEGFHGLAEVIGLDNTIKTIIYFEGSERYFPKIGSTFKHVRDRVIRRKWKKHNIRELAKEFNLTHNQIRWIVRDHEAQLDLIPKVSF